MLKQITRRQVIFGKIELLFYELEATSTRDIERIQILIDVGDPGWLGEEIKINPSFQEARLRLVASRIAEYEKPILGIGMRICREDCEGGRTNLIHFEYPI